MSLIQTIKVAQLNARKERRSGDAAVLTTLIGEAEAVGKNNGNREVTDQEVVAMIKKFIKNIDEVLSVVQPGTDSHTKSQSEKSLLSTFLPQQLDEAGLRTVMQGLIATHGIAGQKGMGVLMKELKAAHDGTYDGSMASKLAKELLA